MVAAKGFDESPKEVTAEAWLGTAWQLIFMTRDVLFILNEELEFDEDVQDRVSMLLDHSKEFLARSFKKMSDEDKAIAKKKLMEAYDD
jgi:hypothetical protein